MDQVPDADTYPARDDSNDHAIYPQTRSHCGNNTLSCEIVNVASSPYVEILAPAYKNDRILRAQKKVA